MSREAKPLIHGEREHSEHKMGHHFRSSAHPHRPCSEFIFQTPVYALCQGPLTEPVCFGPTQLARLFSEKRFLHFWPVRMRVNSISS